MSKHIHAEICKELNELYIKKNNDYGDSFAKLRNEIPDAILVRIYDKYSRLKTLKHGKVQLVNDESIRDSIIDLANYCIMELVEMRKDTEDHEPTKIYEPIKPIVYDEIEYVEPGTGKIKKLGLG